MSDEPRPAVEQGLPPRQIPYTPSDCQINLIPGTANDGTQFFFFIVDTGNVRAVTYWKPEQIEGLAKMLLETIGKDSPRIVLANVDDVRQLGKNGGFKP